MPMPGRSQEDATAYRYGFGGQERDDEVHNLGGTSYTADYWQYDPRIGRRWNIDPIDYPWQSPYAAFNNDPIYYADPLGLEGGPYKVFPGAQGSGSVALPSNATGIYTFPNSTAHGSITGQEFSVNQDGLASFNVDGVQYFSHFSTETGQFTAYKPLDGGREYSYIPPISTLGATLASSTLGSTAIAPLSGPVNSVPRNAVTGSMAAVDNSIIGSLHFAIGLANGDTWKGLYSLTTLQGQAELAGSFLRTVNNIPNWDSYDYGYHTTSFALLVATRGRAPENIVAQEAKEISKRIGRNEVMIKTVDKHYLYDLQGATHKGVPTPHVQRKLPNIDSGGKLFWNKDRKWVEPMTMQDIRIIKGYLRRTGY